MYVCLYAYTDIDMYMCDGIYAYKYGGIYAFCSRELRRYTCLNKL